MPTKEVRVFQLPDILVPEEIQIRFEQHCEGGDPALNGIIKWINPDIPPAPPVLTANSTRKGAWMTTTLNWSTEATGVDVYYNGVLVDSFDQQTTSPTLRIEI